MSKNVIKGVLDKLGVQNLNGPLTNSKSLLISQATLDVIDKATLSVPEEKIEQVVVPEMVSWNLESQQPSVVEQSIDDVLSNSGREIIDDSIPSLENPAQFMQKYESAYIGNQNVQQMPNVGNELSAMESIPEIKPVQPVIENVESAMNQFAMPQDEPTIEPYIPQATAIPAEPVVPQYSVPTFTDTYVAPIIEPAVSETLIAATEPIASAETPMTYVPEANDFAKNDNKIIDDVFKIIDDNIARLKGNISEMLIAKGYDIDAISQVVDEEMGRLHK